MNHLAFLNNPLIMPFVAVLIVIYQLLSGLHIPYALGFSIICLTILVRLIIYPFTASQLKASQKMQKITPHLNKLREQHKGDSQRLQQETMKLYKEHGVNPVAGCLPLLIQLPVIWALYSVLNNLVAADPHLAMIEINKHLYPFLHSLQLTKPWDTSFFGLPIGQSPKQLLSSSGPVVLLVPVLTAFFQFIQSKMMVPLTEPTPKAEKKADDFASMFQTQSLYLMPLMIGFFSFSFPIGLSLYWNTFTIFGILQQYRIAGLGSLSSWVGKK